MSNDRKTPRHLQDAIARNRENVAAKPQSAVAEHNLASALGNAQYWREALTHIRCAFRKGADAPESWLVLARALVEAAEYQEAERAYVEALRRRPAYYDAMLELAQLRWMETGDAARTLADIDTAIKANPGDARMSLLRVQVLSNTGDDQGAYAATQSLVRQFPNDPPVLTAASQCALAIHTVDEALQLGRRAFELAPGAPVTATSYANACLAAGDPAQALRPVAMARDADPDNQFAIALLAVAWRLLGDLRYRELYDYKTMVRTYQLGTPPGWPTFDDYLTDLRDALAATHALKAHPFNQSIKHGTQSTSILDGSHPALQALPAALDPPIRQYAADIGKGGDPLRARNAGDYAIHGIWSIRMQAGGFHIDHVHPQGWISSACYLSVPDAPVGKEGWLRFGQPGTPTHPPALAEHYVEPKPGLIALFPSYMWHGTEPFSGTGTRMTFALDIVPQT